MNRVHQVVLVVSTLYGSWLGMQDVHELGHVAAAWLTGGRVSKVVLYPFTISRTALADNPRPLVVVWGGPIVGAALPLAVWLTARALRLRGEFVLRFFAGFCLIANGAYIGAGSFTRAGDAGEMLKYGALSWQLWLFGALTAPTGLWLWNRLGPHFGLGKAEGAVSRPVAYFTFAGCLVLFAMGFAFGGRD
jgi:Peptidase M50B-like